MADYDTKITRIGFAYYMIKFSERVGIVSVDRALQMDFMSKDLRNSLWNELYSSLLAWGETSSFFELWRAATQTIWVRFYKLPVDQIGNSAYNRNTDLKQLFFEATYSGVYDVIEFVATLPLRPTFRKDFVDSCNKVLEEESSGYRFVDYLLVPITSKTELSSIQDALDATSKVAKLKGVHIHLSEALKKISDRGNRDYRNSIKESISAVEAIADALTNSSVDKLGTALSALKTKLGLHEALIKGFKSMYGYTSDDDGIRHFLMDESTCDIEDALYMLVSCSAFVNYLMAKAKKAKML
jgi:hypothetical protein